MLSYDSPMPVNGQLNGQKSSSLTNGIQQAVASKTQPSVPGVPTSAANGAHVNGNLNTKYHHIWLVTGPAGCGKTTVAEYLAQNLNLPYIEGDSFHPKANIEKMANGIPLTDADRWDWLVALREESRNQLSAGSDGVVLTCSALKRKYRDVIRVAGYYDRTILIHFIYLSAPEEVLVQRVTARSAATNHYMGANMVRSQFQSLEPPMADETDVISVDVSRSIEEVEIDALARVKAMMEKEDEQ
ncbi:putative gluconokinase [Colletotrichum gloeosporioides]|uniref:Gluconokinase n=2 Tax=Colletotrichum gloeosporioides TaxID=474922 RepID=T0KC29_COLGC|nr:putative gluconokinase [Colletotrichum gloeosporioides]EQB50488.1 thermoresistant glucokinase family carbohydrate kinase [Colletotrichum gloeosporioides Cg-14]KAF3803592.1 putative gluconokinase [Colletotrichum gloeosporioides]